MADDLEAFEDQLERIAFQAKFAAIQLEWLLDEINGAPEGAADG